MALVLDNEGSASTGFHVPIDLVSTDGPAEHRRVWLEPGENTISVEFHPDVRNVAVVGLERILGDHEVDGAIVLR